MPIAKQQPGLAARVILVIARQRPCDDIARQRRFHHGDIVGARRQAQHEVQAGRAVVHRQRLAELAANGLEQRFAPLGIDAAHAPDVRHEMPSAMNSASTACVRICPPRNISDSPVAKASAKAGGTTR